MPSKKKKYNARFPAGRIKKIMQTDEEVGKVAQAVPVIISKALEMFIASLLKKSMHITQNRNAKTLTPSHMKQCILSESRFDFLKDLVKYIPDASVQEDNENNALAESNSNFGLIPDEPTTVPVVVKEDGPSSCAVIHFGPNLSTKPESDCKLKFSVNSLINVEHDDDDDDDNNEESKLHVTIASQQQKHIAPTSNSTCAGHCSSSNAGDNLCIDEDYDN